jgi:hypothetical protein
MVKNGGNHMSEFFFEFFGIMFSVAFAIEIFSHNEKTIFNRLMLRIFGDQSRKSAKSQPSLRRVCSKTNKKPVNYAFTPFPTFNRLMEALAEADTLV